LYSVFKETKSDIEILVPGTVSNHNKIQAAFDKYKDTLQKR